MKRVLCVMLVFFICVFTIPRTYGAEVVTSAQSAVLYCPDNGETYYSKSADSRMKMASTTKIMTALLTLEYASENNKRVKFTREMIAEGSSMYLQIGEVVTLRDLAVGLLLCSGNDAANAAAISISGSIEKFSQLMNKRAKQIGMKNTSFVTPSGLDHDNHYSTARDMALLMSVALENKDFCEITSMKSCTVDFIKPENKRVTYSNHNRLLSIYEHCIGGKTGYTMAAGRCLVTASKKDGLTLVCVTLNDRNDWKDHVALYEYGFDNYCMLCLDDNDFFLEVDTVGGERDTTTVRGQGVTDIVLPASEYLKVKERVLLDNFIYAPIRDGDKIGRIIYILNGQVIAKHPIVAVIYNNSEKENKTFKGMFENVI